MSDLENWLKTVEPPFRKQIYESSLGKLIAMHVSKHPPIKEFVQNPTNEYFLAKYIHALRENIIFWRDHSVNLILDQMYSTSIDEIRSIGRSWDLKNKAEELSVISSKTIFSPYARELIQFEKQNHKKFFPSQENPLGKERPHYMQYAQQGTRELNLLLPKEKSCTTEDVETYRAKSEEWNKSSNPIINTILGQNISSNIITSEELQKRGVSHIQLGEKIAESVALKFAKGITKKIAKNKVDPRASPSWIENPLGEPIQDLVRVAYVTNDLILPGEEFSGALNYFFNHYKHIQGLNPTIVKNDYWRKDKSPANGNDVRLVKIVINPDLEYLMTLDLPRPEANPFNGFFDGEINEFQMRKSINQIFGYSFAAKTFQDSVYYHIGPKAHHIYANGKIKARNELPKELRPLFDRIYDTTFQLMS